MQITTKNNRVLALMDNTFTFTIKESLKSLQEANLEISCLKARLRNKKINKKNKKANPKDLHYFACKSNHQYAEV